MSCQVPLPVRCADLASMDFEFFCKHGNTWAGSCQLEKHVGVKLLFSSLQTLSRQTSPFQNSLNLFIL